MHIPLKVEIIETYFLKQPLTVRKNVFIVQYIVEEISAVRKIGTSKLFLLLKAY